MGYVVVVGERLSEEMIDAGEELTKRLEEENVPVKASFWFFLADSSRWRLMVATPEVGKKGLQKTYMKVGKILSSMEVGKPVLNLDDVTLLESNHRLVGLLRTVARTGSRRKESRIRLKGNTVNGQYIEDALIYRMT